MYLVHQHQAAQPVGFLVVGVVYNPAVAVLVLGDFGIVACAGPCVVALDEHLEFVVEHPAAALVIVGAEQVGRPAVYGSVGAAGTAAAAAVGTKEIIVLSAFVDVSSLEGSAAYVYLFRAGLEGKAVFAQLQCVDAVVASEEQVLVSVFLEVAWVDTDLVSLGTSTPCHSQAYRGCRRV